MTNTDKVLALLMSARTFGEGWVGIGKFLEYGCGTRFGGRIFDLRRQGYQIEMKFFGVTGRGDYRYALRGEPVAAPPPTQALTPQGMLW